MAKFTLASGSTHDLTSVAINPNAAPVATPREGGFVLRNRIKWGSVNSSAELTADGSANANVLRILQVPKRTIIRALSFHVVPGSTAATHAFTSGGSSAGSAAKFQVGADMYKTASQVASSIKNDVDAFKTSITVTKKTGAIGSTFGTVNASTPWTQAVNIGTSSTIKAIPFPFGGFVRMNIKSSTGSSGSVMTNAKMAGVLEVRAVCDYMPE